MLALTREQLLAGLAKIPALADRYQRREPDFAAEVAAWLRDFEAQLAPLRHPLMSYLASRRGLLLGTAEGALGDAAPQARGSRRKATAGCALQAMADVEQAARAEITRIDEQFDAWRDKLVQLLAVASSREPIPLPNGDGRQDWLNRVWRQLGEIPDTLSMFNYLNAAVSLGDRLNLLDEVLINLLAGNGHTPPAPAAHEPAPTTSPAKPAHRRRKRGA